MLVEILNYRYSKHYNKATNKIEIISQVFNYIGNESPTEDIYSEMINFDNMGIAYENLLQVFFSKNVGRSPLLEPITGKPNDIIWIGNEVYCGFGMQKIDIFTILSDDRDNKTFNLVELKCIPSYPEIFFQLKRYSDWAISYLKGSINSNIQPIIVTRKVKDGFKKSGKPYKIQFSRDESKKAFKSLNDLKISKKIKWFEFDFIENTIVFNEVNYELN